MQFATLSHEDTVLDVKTPNGRLSLVLLEDNTVVVRALYRGDGTGRIPTMVASLPNGAENFDASAARFTPNPA
jgi:hypothetical protein